MIFLKRKKKVTSLLNQLKKLNYENYIKRNPFLDEQTFKAELERLRLEVYRIYSRGIAINRKKNSSG